MSIFKYLLSLIIISLGSFFKQVNAELTEPFTLDFVWEVCGLFVNTWMICGCGCGRCVIPKVSDNFWPLFSNFEETEASLSSDRPG